MRILIILSLLLSFSCSASLVLTKEQTSQIRQDLIEFEGVKREIYIGKLGVPTLGVGQTLGHRENNKVTLWSLKEINSFFKSAGIRQMSSVTYKELKRLVAITNANLKKGKDAPHGLTIKSSKRKYRLSNREVNKLLDKSIQDTVNDINYDAERLGIDLEGLPVAAIPGLIDLRYRGKRKLALSKKTPKINAAIKQKDMLSFTKEMYAYSNSNEVWQNDARNAYYSSHVLAILSKEDQEAFLKFKNSSKKARTVNKRIINLLKQHPGSVTQEVYASIHKLVTS